LAKHQGFGLCQHCRAQLSDRIRTCAACGRRARLYLKGRCRPCYERSRYRPCQQCGRHRRHGGFGLCQGCYARDPARVATWTARRLARLGAIAPAWLAELAADLTGRGHPARTIKHLRAVERAVLGGASSPAEVVAALRTTTASTATCVLVAESFQRLGLGSFDDRPAQQGARHAARRQQRLEQLPADLRPVIEAHLADLDRQRHRAGLYGGRGLVESTVDDRLAALVTLATLLATRGVHDWASVSAADIEAFLTREVAKRLAAVRGLFAFAKRRRLVLVDPTSGIRRRQPKGFGGRVLSRPEQHQLLGRWSRPETDPRERVVGLLGLLHGASSAELRRLTIDDLDLAAARVCLGRRHQPVPLDPLSIDALRACLDARSRLATSNPHLLITRRNRYHDGPCSIGFPEWLLAELEVTPQVLRQTRLADLAHRVDPRVVAAVFGVRPESALHYLIGTVDQEADAFHPDQRPDQQAEQVAAASQRSGPDA
jgi:integrase